MQVFLNELATGFQISKVGDAITDGLKIFDCQIDINASSHGDQVQDCIRAATQCHDGHHGILKRGTRHDVTWFDVRFKKLEDGVTSSLAFFFFGGIFRGYAG